MIYHNIKSFGREDGKEPRHLMLYFYDDNPSLEYRYRRCHEEQYLGNLCVSVRDYYYYYKFQIQPGIFNPILFGKHLFQQFVVDTYIKIESSRLDYIRNHQTEIRADLYQGLVDSLHAGEGRSEAVGKRTVTPSSFIRGPRDMRSRYMDAMALV